MATFSVRTPAKINLGLRILGHESKRHLLDTVLYAIPLYDHLTFTLIPPSNALVSMALTALTSETVSVSAERPSLTRSAVEISTTGPFGYLTPTDDTNVVSKILAKYSDCNWQVQIDKQIPVAAGLAGGTADAAAAILALLEYEFVNEREAIEIAETEGSDLAFCYQALRHGLPYAALGTHFGEVLQQISTELQLSVTLVGFNSGLSTAQVFQQYDQLVSRGVSDTDLANNSIHSTGSSDSGVSSERDELQLIIAALEQNNPLDIWQHFFNDLRPAAELLEPRLINANGFLSGSGPTLIYPSSHQPPDPTQFDFVLAVSS